METSHLGLKTNLDTSTGKKRPLDYMDSSKNSNFENLPPNKSLRYSKKPSVSNFLVSSPFSLGTTNESRSSLGYSSGSSTGNSPLSLPIDSPTSSSNGFLITSQFTALRRVHSSNCLNSKRNDLSSFQPIHRSNSIDGANMEAVVNPSEVANSTYMSDGNESLETDDLIYMSDGNESLETDDLIYMSDGNVFSETDGSVNMSLEKDGSESAGGYESDMEELLKTFENDFNVGEGKNIEELLDDNSDGRSNNFNQQTPDNIDQDAQSKLISKSKTCDNFQSIAISDK